MYVRAVDLTDFRSWSRFTGEFTRGATVFYGSNGNGKTNILEALGYLATLGSHRVATDAPLIRAGHPRATVSATVVSDERELSIDVEINAVGANRARLNGGPRRPREILGGLRTVLFSPEDIELVRGDPGGRRRYLDDLLVSMRPQLAALRADYDKVLRQRSALLKTAAKRHADLSTLDVWDGHLATHGAALVYRRLVLIHQLMPHIVGNYTDIAPQSRTPRVQYRSSLSLESQLLDPTRELQPADQQLIESTMLADLGRVRRNEIDRGVCLIGPHRDDFELILGDNPAKGFASHGESWSFALSLRLGALALLADDGAEPVLLLDDVFAELDRRRRDALAAVAARTEQVLITAAVLEDVPPALAARTVGVELVDDESGQISRVRA